MLSYPAPGVRGMTAAVVTSVDDALALLRAGVEAMQAVDLHGLAESALVEAARELEAVSRQVSSAVTSMDGHLSQRMVAGSLGYLNDTSLLRGLHRLTAGQAKARLRLGDLVGERRSVTGEVLPPELPATAAGFAAGSLSPAHVVVIADVLRALPEPVRREHRAAIDELLATHAATLDTRDLKALAERLVATLHPDGPEPSDEIRDGKRAGWLRVAPDGSGELWARLTPSAVALWQTVLTPLLTSGHEPAFRTSWRATTRCHRPRRSSSVRTGARRRRSSTTRWRKPPAACSWPESYPPPPACRRR